MTRRALTDSTIRKLRPGAKRQTIADPGCLNLYLRIMPSGARSFVVVARDPYQRQQWVTLGSADHLKIEEARAKAREIITRVKAGMDAFEPPPPKPESFREVADGWFKRHVEEKQLRSRNEIRRSLEKYILPHFGDRPFAEIKRSDVTRLLDHVADRHGKTMADAVLAYVSAIMKWFARRTDDYTVPLVAGMRRTSIKETARTRMLNDDELRAVWKRAEANGQYGAIIRLLLLTAQRRDKVVTMRWSDVSVDGVWSIATEEREKGNAGELQLTPQAVAIIRAQPRLEANEYVFAGRRAGPVNNFSNMKREFDAALPPMPPWTLHDLRRTARSLMSRAGVRPDVSERTLGHVQAGVLGVYDRHQYFEEKADALRRLAALIETIVDPKGGNVVSIVGKAVRS